MFKAYSAQDPSRPSIIQINANQIKHIRPNPVSCSYIVIQTRLRSPSRPQARSVAYNYHVIVVKVSQTATYVPALYACMPVLMSVCLVRLYV